MANDIDLWQDIEDLEKEGKNQEAGDLLEIFRYRYIEYNEQKFERAKDKHFKQYGYTPNV